MTVVDVVAAAVRPEVAEVLHAEDLEVVLAEAVVDLAQKVVKKSLLCDQS